ncbi:hypothetical protein H696_00168 [Fonticula alba]|uniref:Importin N-terminal domain-containing protein n=1 Tax=Fonticula alba TaxID=691883 RepID=A0A058ZGG1_FONAL|nr:hypothetical protein H696_00168 [Fonticula alba]KCV72577.1 hypothetical protein H696_00168 [Fonticula alba]|eukprot:XP_009492278.1 hypothetical protein H696_00168 [Fonticula alba]
MSSIQRIISALSAMTDVGSVNDAELFFRTAASIPGYAPILLSLAIGDTMDASISSIEPAVSLSAALMLKNFLAIAWTSATNPDRLPFPAGDRIAIRERIVPALFSCSSTPQRNLLLTCLATISNSQYPSKWPELLGLLLSEVDTSNPAKINTVLQALNTVLKRFKSHNRTERLVADLLQASAELKDVLPQFAEVIGSHITTGADDQTLAISFHSLSLLCEIITSLCYLDLPDDIEVNMPRVFAVLRAVLHFHPQGRTYPEDEEDPYANPPAYFRLSLCALIDLFTNSYHEYFEKELPSFFDSIFHLLVGFAESSTYDRFVAAAIRYTCTVVSKPAYATTVCTPPGLTLLASKIILPSLQLRDSDEEVFEDTPMDYVRHELEGHDAATPRSTAGRLINALATRYRESFTQICIGLARDQLTSQPLGPDSWRAMEAALTLVHSVASAGGVTLRDGVVATNEFLSPDDAFAIFETPLTSPDFAHFPFLVARSLYFLVMFRNHLSTEIVLKTMPYLVGLLASPNQVLHTFAAVAVGQYFARHRVTLAHSVALELLEPLFAGMFSIFMRNGTAPLRVSENNYAMLAVVRTLLFYRPVLVAAPRIFVSAYVELLGVLSIICTNPSNPRLSHCLFEAIGALSRPLPTHSPALPGFLASTGQTPAELPARVLELHAGFERALLPVMGEILKAGVAEFIPYSFQIIALMLESNPSVLQAAGAAPGAAPSLNQFYLDILPSLFVPVLWEVSANISAIARLFCAYLRCVPEEFVSRNLLPPLMDILKRMIGTRAFERDACQLAESLLVYLPAPAFTQFAPTVLLILLERIQSNKTPVFVRLFGGVVSRFIVAKPDSFQVIVSAFNTIQPNLFYMVLNSVLLAEEASAGLPIDRKVAAVALAYLIARSPLFFEPTYAERLPHTVQAIFTLGDRPATTTDDYSASQDFESAFLNSTVASGEGTTGSFSALSTVTPTKEDPLPKVQDVQSLLVGELTDACQKNPQYRQLLQGLSTVSPNMVPDAGKIASLAGLVLSRV